MQLIKGVSISALPDAKNTIFWCEDKSGMFTIRSAFNLIACSMDYNGHDWWRLWKTKGPVKVKMLLWFACHEKLHTHVLRKIRGLSDLEVCLLCSDIPEMVLHTLHDCVWVVEVWEVFLPHNLRPTFYTLNIWE